MLREPPNAPHAYDCENSYFEIGVFAGVCAGLFVGLGVHRRGKESRSDFAGVMTSPQSLQHEIGKRHPFEQPEAEAFLNVLRSASLLVGPFEQLFKAHDLTSAMYNALRILRGAGEQGKMCHEIGRELVSRVPDVTRLLDRLEKAGLAERTRCSEDRRVIYVRITSKGLEQLSRLDAPVAELHREQMGHMTRKELAELSRLLVKARERTPSHGAS
jgi:DNA-binding MarR family transcriptional regulator